MSKTGIDNTVQLQEKGQMRRGRPLFISLNIHFAWNLHLLSPFVSFPSISYLSFFVFLLLTCSLSIFSKEYGSNSQQRITKEITSMLALNSPPLFTPLGSLLLSYCFISALVFSLKLFYSLTFLGFCSLSS